MIGAIIQALGQFGFAVGDQVINSVSRVIQVEGDLLLARAAVKLAQTTKMDDAEIRKRQGTVQTLESERVICREDLIRAVPIAAESQLSGLVGWAISHAALLARPSMED